MADEVVVGASKKPGQWTLVDRNLNPIDLTGGSARLQASSPDIGKTIDVAIAVSNPAQGVVSYVGLGTLVTTGDMGGRPQATFHCRIKYTDAGALIDWSPVFDLIYKLPPV